MFDISYIYMRESERYYIFWLHSNFTALLRTNSSWLASTLLDHYNVPVGSGTDELGLDPKLLESPSSITTPG